MLATSLPPVLGAQAAGARTVYRVGSHWLVMLRGALHDEPDPLKRRYRAALNGRFADLRFEAAIFNSDSLREDYRQAGFDVSRLVVIPSGIPEDWIAAPRDRAPDGALRLLYVGRLEDDKGTGIALEAAAHVIREHPGVSLDLIGRGQPDYVARLAGAIAESGVGDRVRLLGFVPRDDLLRRYAEYDVLLFTTPRREGLPMAVLEAMSQGLAVIASDIGGPRDLIAPGQTGLLVPPGDPAALAQAVRTVAQHPALVRDLGAAAIRVVREKHTFTRMLDAYEAYLESL
jgi:glycosyltransferase involved in cell wall biosynthesis